MLRLLIRTDKSVVSGPSVVLDDGRRWEVVCANSLPSTPPYVCISYAWGDNPIPNIMYGDPNLMSARTKSVLQTAIHALPDDKDPAIWIDAFCLPPRGDPSRTDAIDRMGDIYLEASQVIVVLSEESYCFLKLARVSIPGQADMTHTAALEALDKDTWIARAWTYQEIANNYGCQFVTEGHPEDTLVDLASLLNALGNTKMAYRRPYINDDGTTRTPDSETSVRLRLPNIDLFEEALLDCSVGDPLQRSALQTMSNVTHRIRERGEDYFNAMIGAVVETAESSSIRINWKNISESPLVQELGSQVVFSPTTQIERKQSTVDSILEPMKIAYAANRFMQTCERNGDFSFIYTTAERSKLKGQTWRPVAEVLKPICSWHSWGTGQPGEIKDGRLELQQMFPVRPGILSDDATRFIATWVGFFYPERDLPISVEDVKQCVQEVGFSSADENMEPVVLEDGYFFPQRRVDEGNIGRVFVSSVIRRVFGAPAIMITQGNRGEYAGPFTCVGIFVGNVYAMSNGLQAVTVRLE